MRGGGQRGSKREKRGGDLPGSRHPAGGPLPRPEEDSAQVGGSALKARTPLTVGAEAVEVILAEAGLAPLGDEGVFLITEAELLGVGRQRGRQLDRLLKPHGREQGLGQRVLFFRG